MDRLITDSGNKLKRPPNPRSNANVLEILTFSWLFDLFKIGHNRDLNENDLYETLEDHSSSILGNKLEKTWKLEVQHAYKVHRNPSLLRALIKIFGAEYMLYGIIQCFQEIILRTCRPLLIGGILAYFNTDDSNKTDVTKASIFACGLLISMIIATFIYHPNKLGNSHCGMKMRVACCSLIYRKALCISHSVFGETSVGHVINLLSNDVNRFDVSIIYIHYLWIGPLQTIIISYFLWQEAGLSSLIGMSTFLIFIPLQSILGKNISKIRLKTANKTDERVRLMNEIISGIQLIKMYTWEKPFSKIVQYARKKEIQHVRAMLYVRAILSSITLIHTKFQMFIIIAAYVLLGNYVSIKNIFVIISFYNILGDTMRIFFCLTLVNTRELLVSIKRIQNFLLLEEKDSVSLENTQAVNVVKNGGIELTVYDDNFTKNNDGLEKITNRNDIIFSNATAKWTRVQTSNTLENINLTLESARLSAIVGPVGSGKSSLLQAILRELPLSEGSISIRGVVSYASQEPWIFRGSVQQNIIFNSPMDKKRYKQVIKVCALKSDIEQFPFGDRTIVGEKGVILSGGQRARINLARAVYRKADIYLLDDPLSAVDTTVGKNLFEKCIKDYLKDTTCILVTHQIQYLANVDKIIIMNEASVVVEGSYRELQASGIDFSKLLELSSENKIMEQLDAEANKITKEDIDVNPSTSAHSSNESIASSVDEIKVNGIIENPREKPEIRSTGRVSKTVYLSYLSAGGSNFKVFLLFFMYFLAQILNIGGSYWISIWATEEENAFRNTNNVTAYNNATSLTGGPYYNSFISWSNVHHNFVVVYTVLILSFIVLVLISPTVFVSVCMSSSINLHNKMFNSIVKATMYFFNTNPSGRTLNRFSKDIGAIDEMIPAVILDFLRVIMLLFEIVIVVVLFNVYLIIPSIIAGMIFYQIITFYFKTSRSIKRLEGVSRSPIFSYMNESLQGLKTIRAYNAEKILYDEFDKQQDLHSSAWYLFISANNGFSFWVDIICISFISIVLFSFLAIGDSLIAYKGLFGLVLTQVIRLFGAVQIGLTIFAMLENQITAVERVMEIINSPREIGHQCPSNCSSKAPPKEWPKFGEIVFQNVYLRYSLNDQLYVLKNISFRIQPMEKVGIVGRTGAGKSSIARALFRLACNEGNITVDGVNIDYLGLKDLRSKFSIIPQEPVLFSGTMRTNLDPFDEYPDHVLWNALDKVELKVFIEGLPGGLNSKMSENGLNFSVGQRQLVCLARAIVRDNKILVLDEATANVDTQTDALIQQSIRSIFKTCTVLTIAHRLNTVMDSDRVLVMDAGRVVEFDHPHDLLRNKDGLLYRMVKEMGPDTADALRAVAAESFKTLQTKKESTITYIDDGASIESY